MISCNWENFQEYEQAMKLLREVYFPNTLTSREIRDRNTAYISDMGLVTGIIEAVMYQANANNNNFTANSGPKNTFLFR